ncbi:zinc finger, CCHC-type containing protein [Tanacetum coccineum]
MAAAMKHMASNFAKLEKFELVDFKRWKKKIHFLLSSMSVVYVLTTPMLDDGGENPTVDQNVETSKELWDTLEAKYMAEDALSKKFLVSCIIDKLPPSWKDFKHTLKHLKEELTLIELGSQLRIEESLRAHDNDKPKGNNFVGPSVVNMLEHNNSSRIAKLVMLAIEPMDQARRDQRMDDDVSWWVDSGETVHVCKDRCWFKTYELLNYGSILHMGNESTALVHGRGCVDIRLNIVFDNIDSAFMSTSKLNDSILWHARLGHVHFKRMQDMSKDRAVVRLPNLKLKTLVKEALNASLLDMLSIPRLLGSMLLNLMIHFLLTLSLNQGMLSLMSTCSFSSVT